MSKNQILTCKRPDRHEPGLVCGSPLPCPHHTVIIEIPVLNFAETMQHKLDKNKFKSCDKMNSDGMGRTWVDCDLHWLLLRLREETIELETALWAGNRDDIIKETADVGNFAMMIHDIVSACPVEETTLQPRNNSNKSGHDAHKHLSRR